MLLSIIPSKSIHVFKDGKIFVFFMAELMCVCMYTPHILYLFIYDGHLLLHIFSIVNKAVVIIGMYISFWFSVIFNHKIMFKQGKALTLDRIFTIIKTHIFNKYDTGMT